LYSEKEVFIGELLVSNANNDAIEKFCYLSMATPAAVENLDRPLEIHLSPNSATNTLVIQDTGIGMTQQELVDNLGSHRAHRGGRRRDLIVHGNVQTNWYRSTERSSQHVPSARLLQYYVD
jgi:hypothetical protein